MITAATTLSSAGTGTAIGVIPYLTGGVTAGSGGDSLVTMSANGVRLLDFSPTTTDYIFQAVAANTSLAAAELVETTSMWTSRPTISMPRWMRAPLWAGSVWTTPVARDRT